MSKFLIGNIKGPKGDKGEQGAIGPKGEQGIQGPVGPAGGVNSVNGMTGDVTVEDTQGVNLVLDSAVEKSTAYGDVRVQAVYYMTEQFQLGTTYTITAWAKVGDGVDGFGMDLSNGASISPQLRKVAEGVYSTVINRSVPFPVPLNDTKFMITPRPWQAGMTATIERFKIEKGTVPDPVWTPAPEDVLLKGEVDGRNLILDSAKEISNSDYKIAQYLLSEDFEKGRYYTITVWGELGAGLTSFRTFIGGGNVSISDTKKISDGIYSAYAIRNSIPEDTDTKLLYIFIDKQDLGVASTIHKIKLEPGINPNPHWTPAPEDVVTKTPPDIFDALDSIPEMHRNIFRGKNLGTVFTDEQKANIKNGTFDDLWVGDYWTIHSHTWRIADINYWLRKGDTSCETNHILVVPDNSLYSHRMNEGDTTEGGYTTSEMRTSGLDQAKTIVNTDFGEAYVLNHRSLFTNAVVNGHPSAGAWADSTVDLMNEVMVYGSHFFAPANNGTTIPYLQTIDNVQLALFRLCPKFVNIQRSWYWLRDVVSATDFAGVSDFGYASYAYASAVPGVRPVVGITGGTASADEPNDDLEITGLSGKGGEPL